jgi:hypothetical protein
MNPTTSITRRLAVGGAIVAMVTTLGASPAGAQRPPLGDAVTGTGTIFYGEPPLGGQYAFAFAVEGDPEGDPPTGTVTLDGLASDAPVTCLSVRLVPGGTPFPEATMNIETAAFGLVTVQVSEGSPEGLPDFVSAQVPSPRGPDDCSPLSFSATNVRAQVTSGDIVIRDLPPPPTTRRQCTRGGYLTWGFRNQGDCFDYVRHGPRS